MKRKIRTKTRSKAKTKAGIIKTRTIITILATILFVPSVLLFSFSTLIFNEPFTNQLLDQFSEHPEEAKLATAELFSYYKGDRILPPQIFSQEEQAHLQDTKPVINGFQKAALIILIVFLVLLLFSDVKFVLRKGCLAIIIVSLVVLVFFNQFFSLFHFAFFKPGSWQFHTGSLIVQFYTFSFFAAYGFWIFAKAAILSVLLALASFIWQ